MVSKNGMVATSQYLAARAGLEMLREGGNAVDAAVAAAACLTVVEPTSNGIGSDAFAMVWHRGRLHGLNSSGAAPGAITRAALVRAGHKTMPKFGVLPVTVPGAPAAWAALNRRFGRLPLTRVLAPAVRYAEEGYPVSPVVAAAWARSVDIYRKELKGAVRDSWFSHFSVNGKAPRAGETWKSPAMAATLREIAETGAASFYRGRLARAMHSFFRKNNGYLSVGDLEGFKPEWVSPLSAKYRGYDVWELPPNGQGLVVLMALSILDGIDLGKAPSPGAVHKQIEAIKLAFADGLHYITDPGEMLLKARDFLSQAYASERRALIGSRAGLPFPGRPLPSGGTVYLAAADQDGNMVSYIQSNYAGFGSGVVVPGTGISMQNRGFGFSLDPAHANCLEPGKKSYHTIIPGFLTKHGKAIGPFGVMGAFMQPQGHVQVICNSIDYGMNPQAALDAPRWFWKKEKEVDVEPAFEKRFLSFLKKAGHKIAVQGNPSPFGRGQIIWRGKNGVYTGGTDPRADGEVAAF